MLLIVGEALKIIYFITIIIINLSISVFAQVLLNKYKQYLMGIYMKTTNYLGKCFILVLLTILFILSYPTRLFSEIILPVSKSIFESRNKR